MLRGGACDANLLVHDGDNDSEHDLSSHHQHQEQRVLQPAHTHASPSTAHLHIIHTMSSRVYETVRCPSVCLSRSHAAAACGAGLRYRSIAARPAPQQHGAAARRAAANAGSATFSAYEDRCVWPIARRRTCTRQRRSCL